MPSEQYQFQRLRSVVVLSGVLLAKVASSERSWGDLHIDGDRSWQTTTLPESEGEEEKAGSIAYAALHARTEAFLKASRNYQVAVKGPLMDATDVYLQQKERYERFAHNLDKGERQQHKLIHMMRSSLRKHHGRKMEEFQKTLEAERAEKKAAGEDENEDEDEDDEDEDSQDSQDSDGEESTESGDSGSTESEEGREERSDESGAAPADSDSKENKDESEKQSKESAAPNASSEEHHENPEKESKAKDESEQKSKESAAPSANSEEHHETPENANSEEHHENPEKESKAKDESEQKSKESAAPSANSEEHHETPENANSEEHHENPEKESKAKGCDARKKAKQGTEEWCRCNANAELIKARSPCEDQGGGRKNACVWSVETRSCVPRKQGKPWK